MGSENACDAARICSNSLRGSPSCDSQGCQAAARWLAWRKWGLQHMLLGGWTLPLWKILYIYIERVNWDDEIPNWMEKHKSFFKPPTSMGVSTNGLEWMAFAGKLIYTWYQGVAPFQETSILKPFETWEFGWIWHVSENENKSWDFEAWAPCLFDTPVQEKPSKTCDRSFTDVDRNYRCGNLNCWNSMFLFC